MNPLVSIVSIIIIVTVVVIHHNISVWKDLQQWEVRICAEVCTNRVCLTDEIHLNDIAVSGFVKTSTILSIKYFLLRIKNDDILNQ